MLLQGKTQEEQTLSLGQVDFIAAYFKENLH